MVDQLTLESNWNQIRGKLKEKWGKLTDDDVSSFNGNVDQLVAHLQRKTGESRQVIERFLDQAVSQGNAMLGRAQASVEEAAEHMGDTLSEGYASAERMVHARPGQSMLAAFGCGVVAGLAVAALINSRPRRIEASRGRQTAEHYGRKIVDAIAAAVPDAVASRFHG